MAAASDDTKLVPAASPPPQRESPTTFEKAQDELWIGLNSLDAGHVTYALMGLSRPDRRRLLHTPERRTKATSEETTQEVLRPGLPLSVASAAGDEASVRALLAQGASPMVGDQVRASLLGVAAGTPETSNMVVLTGLFWAAHYGRLGSMDISHGEHGVAIEQAIWACESEARPEVVDWLRERGVKNDQLKRAAMRATDDNRPKCVRTLVQNGRVPLTTYFFSATPLWSHTLPASNFGFLAGAPVSRMHVGWFAYAVGQNKLAVANELIDLGVLTQKVTKTDYERHEEQLLRQVIDIMATPEYFDLYLPLLRKMLACGLPVENVHLKCAIHLGGDHGEELFIVLLRDGNTGPNSLADAADLLQLAQRTKMARIIAILGELTTMLHQDNTTWAQSARKQDKNVVIANARARIINAFEGNGEEFDELPEGAMLASNGAGYVRAPKNKPLRQIADLVGGRSSQMPAPAMAVETGALVLKERKKKFFG